MDLARAIRRLICVGVTLVAGVCPEAAAPAQAAGNTIVLDKVVAVVNNHAILESDLEREVRLTVLEPGGTGSEPRRDALQRLISRTLIQQQIRDEEAQAPLPSEDDVHARVKEFRAELPVCVRENCASEAGWAAFLSAHELSEQQVENYARLRLQLLGFIEQRFRQGINISQTEIEDYYRNTLLPQYGKGETPPKLESVRMRIEEVLLQEQVTKLFGAWLDTLRKQGNVEILDSSLEPAPAVNGGGGNQ